jgi:hypothetical protein
MDIYFLDDDQWNVYLGGLTHGLLLHGPTLHGLIIITVLLVTTAGIGEAVFIIPILFTDTILGLISHGITTHGMIHGSIIPAITVLTMVIPITDITVGVDLIYKPVDPSHNEALSPSGCQRFEKFKY